MTEKYCISCGKKLTGKYQKKFCSRNCAAHYNNSKRTIKKGKLKTKQCLTCGCNIEVSIYSSKKSWYCKEHDCRKNKSVHSKNIDEVNSILEFSKRTAVKILKRMNASCSICGWNESSCDIHHIIPKKDGGTDDMDNLIYICPNCHRVCHTTNKYSTDYLKKYSLLNLYKNWKDFYHPSN